MVASIERVVGTNNILRGGPNYCWAARQSDYSRKAAGPAASVGPLIREVVWLVLDARSAAALVPTQGSPIIAERPSPWGR